MNSFRIKFFLGLLAVLLFLGFGYYQEDFGRLWRYFLNWLQPCQRPIGYSIADVDPRFGLTKEELLAAIKQAERVWEFPLGKQLFEYSSKGDLKIYFIYDHRQQATDELKKRGIVINNDRSSYDALKIRYDSLVASYQRKKAELDGLIADYNKYNSYNSGKSDADLKNQIAKINRAKESLDDLIADINSTATVLNNLAANLNIKVNAYNTINSSVGEEFNQGKYVSDISGAEIDIFQFNDKNQLIMLFAHELGHALGLEHIDDPEAVMYYLNESGNENLTPDDLAALKKTCRVE